MADQMPGPRVGRNNYVQQTSFLRIEIGAGDSLTKSIGTLPEKAIILRGTLLVKEAFATSKVTIGTATSATLLGDISLAAVGRTVLAVPATETWSDDEVELLAVRNAVSTTGSAAIIIEYIQNR